MQHLPILKICSCPCQAGPNALGGVFDQMLELCFFGNDQAVCIAVNHKHSVRHEIVGDHPAGN